MLDPDDDDVELSIESDDDLRFTLTLASLEGRKITQAEFVWRLEEYLKEVNEAEAERHLTKAITQ